MMMRTHSLKLALGAMVLVATLSVPSRDVYSQPVVDADVAQRADALFSKGKALYASGKTRQAYEALSAAWASKKSYDIAANLGSAELTLAMYRDAAEHFAYALRTFPATGNKKQLAGTKQLFEQARAHVGGLTIKVSVEGAEVFVDGKPIGHSPIQEQVFVDSGERAIEVKLAGYEPSKQIAKLANGGSQAIAVTLAPTAPPPVASVSPWPPVTASASPAPALTASAAPPSPPGSAEPLVPLGLDGPSRPVLLTGGIAAGAALIAGVTFVVISNGKSSDVQEQLGALRSTNGARACTGKSVPGGCATVLDTIASKDAFANLALWSFVGAGALGIGTAIYALAAPKGTKKPEVRAAPLVTANGGGIVIGGAW